MNEAPCVVEKSRLFAPGWTAQELCGAGFVLGDSTDYTKDSIDVLTGREQKWCLMRGSKESIRLRHSPGYHPSNYGYEYALAGRLGRAIGGRIKKHGAALFFSDRVLVPSSCPSVVRRMEDEVMSGALEGVCPDLRAPIHGLSVSSRFMFRGIVIAASFDHEKTAALERLGFESLMLDESRKNKI